MVSFSHLNFHRLPKFESNRIIKILIGTKIDLRSISNINHVQENEGLHFAKKHNFYAYCESSKKNRSQTEGIMRIAMKAYYTAKYGRIDKNKKCCIQ
jgi:hypothetical protein